MLNDCPGLVATRDDFVLWRCDHTLEAAITASVYPFCQRTAAAIGREWMQAGLPAPGDASGSFTGELTTLSIDGDLVVARGSLAFLERIFSGRLAVDCRHA